MAIAFVGIQTSPNGGIGTSTVAIPSGVASGHLLVCVQTYASATGTGSAPSGFAEIPAAAIQNAAASTTFRVWWKIAGASEPANYTFTNSANVYQDVALLAYSGTSATPVDVATTASYASVATSGATLPSVTTTAAGDLLLAAITGPTASLWTPTSPLTTRVSGNWDGNDVVDTIISAAGSSGSLVDSPNVAQSNVVATVVAFKAASTGGGAALGGTAVGTASGTGALTARTALGGTTPGVAGMAGTLARSGLAGTASGTAGLSGALVVPSLTGIASGVAGLTGALVPLVGTVMHIVQGPYGDIITVADSSLATYTAQGYAEVAPPYITIANPNPAWEVGPTYRITHTDGRSYAVTYASYQQYYAPLGFTIGRGERGEPTPQ